MLRLAKAVSNCDAPQVSAPRTRAADATRKRTPSETRGLSDQSRNQSHQLWPALNLRFGTPHPVLTVSLTSDSPSPEPILPRNRNQSPTTYEPNDLQHTCASPTQRRMDPRPLRPSRICEKSRQVGISYADAYDSVSRPASRETSRLDIWIILPRRLPGQALPRRLQPLGQGPAPRHRSTSGERLLDPDDNASAFVIQFANGSRIYCLSSNPNALAGKRGHVKLDEFALHLDQRLLYRSRQARHHLGRFPLHHLHPPRHRHRLQPAHPRHPSKKPIPWAGPFTPSHSPKPSTRASSRRSTRKPAATNPAMSSIARIQCRVHRRGAVAPGILLHPRRRILRLHHLRHAQRLPRTPTCGLMSLAELV